MATSSTRRLPDGGFSLPRQATTSTVPGLNRLRIPAAVLALSVTLAGCAGTGMGVGTADAARPTAVGAHGASAAAPGT
ncbi:hypothetical protein K8369_34445, partial [Streptomyces sp. PSKA30]|nr:hypothetical protein [Streptomyces sp. PSKA30]